jgi:hypothetical protein
MELKMPIHDRSPCDEYSHWDSFMTDLDSADWLGILFRSIIDPYDEFGRSSDVMVPVREGSSSVFA